MDDLRLHAVVARVVAWHNSHPLARRITAAQVNSVGYVALPYAAPGLQPAAAPAQPAAEPSAAPPPAVPAPAPQPVEKVDPVIESDNDDPGAIVIDVDPEPRSDSEGDADALTLEVELTAATADDAPTADPSPDQEPPAAPLPESGDEPSTADLSPVSPPAPASRPASSLRSRAQSGEGDAPVPSAASPDPVQPAVLPAEGAPRTLVCSEDFMAPLPVKQVLAWVRKHGLALARSPSDGPVRDVPVDPALLPAGAGVAQLWVATAAIEIGAQRHRLLLGSGDQPAVLGRRSWSPPRLLGVLAAPCVLVAALAWFMWPAAKKVNGEPDAPAAAVPVLASASAAAGSASAASAAYAASAASAASMPEASASAVAKEGESHTQSAAPPRLPALLDDAAKAEARATVAALRAARQASAPAATKAGAATAVAAVAPPPAAPAVRPAPPPAVLFGLSSRLLRTRAEAEQLQSAFQTLLGGTPGSPLRVEMLPAGEDWRVVCWPYERRADAERARALLQARGLRVELVDF